MFYIGLYREKHEIFFLSETTKPKALRFGMRHHLVDLYQVWSNYIPAAKNGPALRVTCFTKAYIERTMNKFSCLEPQGHKP